MSGCRFYQEMMERLLAGELSRRDTTALQDHGQTCQDCAGLLALHKDLLDLGEDRPEPNQADLMNMREQVLRQTVGQETTAHQTSGSSFLRDLQGLWRSHPLTAVLSTAAVLVCAVFIGHKMTPAPTLDQSRLVQEITQQSAMAASLEDYWDAPYSFTNVAVRPRQNGQVALSFDVCRHVDIQQDRSSPLVTEVLLNAILEPSSMGSQFRAMDLTSDIMDERLKQALILTLHNDPDPTVRLNALEALAQHPYGETVQSAFLQVLGQDQDVQMRLTAIEHLSHRQVDLQTIRSAVGEAGFASDDVVLQKAVSLTKAF